MDNVTHSLFALTIARTSLGRSRGTTAALVIASNAPDIDVVTTFAGAASYLEWHRGPTHGPLGVVGLALATAVLVWGAETAGRNLRAPDRRGAAVPRFGPLIVAALVGVLAHILMDLPTSYGTRLLSPFGWRWYAVDLLPIIDIYVLVALVTGLMLGRRSAEMRRRCAAIVLTVMAAHYGVRAAAHHEALRLTMLAFGAALPPRCDIRTSDVPLLDSWPRRVDTSVPCLVDIAALPSFLSPFQWRVVAQTTQAYWMYELNVLDRRTRGGSGSADAGVWLPNTWTPVVAAAAATPTAQTLLGFSRFPHARVFEDVSGDVAVRFTDLRFVTSSEEVDSPVASRRSSLFVVIVRMSRNQEILEERLGQ